MVERRHAEGPESKTDSGRTVYSGGGISPDVALKPDTITAERFRYQQKMASPIFALPSTWRSAG
jgi:hypothetical protein